MELPVNIQRENGSLQLMTIKGIKDFLAACMQHSIDCGDIIPNNLGLSFL